MKITPIMLVIVGGVILWFFLSRKKISGSENGNATIAVLRNTAESARSGVTGKPT